jgi:starch phosphorylase
MSKKPLTESELTEMIQGLHRLARNLWWTWNQESQEIFQELSPRGWQNLYHNAVAVLHEVSDYEVRVHLQNPDFSERVRYVLANFDAYLKDPNTWAATHAPALQKNPVAYFTAEFGFHETLPIAAGRPGDPGRRPRQVRQRYRHRVRRDQPLLSRRLFPANHQPG